VPIPGREKRRFTDGREPLSLEAAKFREIGEKPFQWGAKLVLWFSGRARICELCFRLGAEISDDSFQIGHSGSPRARRSTEWKDVNR
jgi:hypothetical protein